MNMMLKNRAVTFVIIWVSHLCLGPFRPRRSPHPLPPARAGVRDKGHLDRGMEAIGEPGKQ